MLVYYEELKCWADVCKEYEISEPEYGKVVTKCVAALTVSKILHALNALIG